MSFHKCGATGCKARVHVKFFMCRRHWASVPQSLKRQLYDAYYVYLHASRVGIGETRAALKELRLVQNLVRESIRESSLFQS